MNDTMTPETPAKSDRAPAASPRPAAQVQRTLNVPFLIGSLVVFAVLAGIVYGVQSWQVRRTAVAFLTRAEQLEQEEKWFEAAEYIQRYVQLVPTADEERIRLALTYEKGVKNDDHRERAIGLFYRAIGTGLEDQQLLLRKKVAALLLRNRRYFEARSEAEKLLSVGPTDPEGLALRAKGLWGQWQTKVLAPEGLGRRPETIAEEGTNPVIVALEDAVNANPKDIELTVALATAYRDRELKAYQEDDRKRAPHDLVEERTEKRRIELADGLLDVLHIDQSDNPKVYLARYHYRTKWDVAGADRDIAKALELAPDDVEVLLAAAGAARQESLRLRKDGARPEDAKAQLELAREYYAKCLAVEKPLIDPLPAHIGLGEVLMALGQRDDAIASWKKSLELYKSQPVAVEFQTRLVNVTLEQGNLADAEKELQDIKSSIATLPHYVPQQAVLALELDQALRFGVLHMKRGEPKLAIPYLQDVITRQERAGGTSDQSVRALLMLGGAYAAVGDWIQSAEAYDRAALQEPNLAMAQAAASASWLAANNIDAAVERAEHAVRLEAAKSQPTSRSWFALASATFRQQLILAPSERVWSRVDQAMLAAQQLSDDGTLPDPWRIDLLLADALLAREDATQSDEQRQAEALALLRQAETKYPESPAFWEALPLAYQRLGAAGDADRACLRLATLEGGAAPAALLRVRLLSLRGDHLGAEEALLQAARGPDAIDAATAQQELANLKLAQRDLAAGRKSLEEALKQSPGDLNILRRLADIDLDNRKLDNVKQWEAAMEGAGPNGKSLALYFKIRRSLMEAKSTKDALFQSAVESHATLVNLRPNWAEAVALGGLMEESQITGKNEDAAQDAQHAEQAIQHYQRAIALGEQRITIFERLIRLLDRAKRSTDAEMYLSRMRSSVSLSKDLTVFESTLELRRNQIDDAIKVAKAGVEQRPQDPNAHIWLGRLLLQKKLDKEAEQAFQQAIKLKPEEVGPWNAMFDYHLRTGNKAEARAILGEIASKVQLQPGDMSFVLAQGYELLGDRDEAAEAYSQAAAAAPKNAGVLLRAANFYRSSDTEKSLAFARQAWKLSPSSADARRTLAAVLSDRGKDEDWQEVEQLLTDATVDAASATKDNRFRAILLTRRGGAKNLAEAARIIEDLLARPESQSDGDRLLLAQLYERQARLADGSAAQSLLEKAYEQLSTLGTRATIQPVHLIALVEFSLRHRRTENAEQWLASLAKLLDPAQKPTSGLLAEYVRLALAQGNIAQAKKYLDVLDKAEPDALVCITLRARLLEKEGKSEELETYIESAAARLYTKATRPDEQAAVCQGIGDLYASLKRLEPAEKWYRQLAQVAPQQFNRLVMVLAEQGQVGEALKVCQEHSNAKNLIATAVAAVGVLASDKASLNETAEGEKLIAAARQQHPEHVQLLSAVATLRVIQGKSEDAVRLFQEMVDKNGNDPLALNNLATMLAEIDGKQDEALKLIDRALKIAGNEPGLLDTKGTILLLKGEAKAAVANLEAAAREPDADPRYRFHLALAYRDLNRKDEAKDALQVAIERDLEKQILTTQERKMLAELRSQLSL